MNKKDLIKEVAKKSEVSQVACEKVLAAILETVSETLAAGDKVQLIGFGTFETKKRAARNGINPLTKKPMKIPATKVPAFKAGAALKETVAK